MTRVIGDPIRDNALPGINGAPAVLSPTTASSAYAATGKPVVAVDPTIHHAKAAVSKLDKPAGDMSREKRRWPPNVVGQAGR